MKLPDVTVAEEWVAVLWDERAPYQVLDRDGEVTERFSLPRTDAQAQLPTGDAA